MISISFVGPFIAPSPLEEQIRAASPGRLVELIVTELNEAKITASVTPYEGWVTIHSDGFDWNLDAVVSGAQTARPSIDLTAVSDDWCESRRKHELVSKKLLQISLILNLAFGLPVRPAPVPCWF